MSPTKLVPAIVVHGGAGPWSTEGDRLPTAVDACRAAAVAGQAVLIEGGSALDAVEAAVHVLEDCPVLDAGIGSYLNREGQVQMDALIMDGRDLDFGAVAAVGRMLHPISLARKVMEDSPHALLAGTGAEAFADDISFPRCENEDLIPKAASAAASAESASANSNDETNVDPAKNRELNPVAGHDSLGDTVGAVALDREGNLAAATSTGGTKNKLPGRVGDSPLIGAGGYADNASAAVSSTGEGEALMKLVIAKRVCDLVREGASASESCAVALEELDHRLGKDGGLIALDAQGGAAFLHNTGAMPYAFVRGAEDVQSGDLRAPIS